MRDKEHPATLIVTNDLDRIYGQGTCAKATLAQTRYLQDEHLSDEFTFDKYKAEPRLTTKPADLDIDSNKYARAFRTVLRSELKDQGPNFDGHYSLVSVDMTYNGSSYYIVDRANGKAYIFPYSAIYSLDFKKDSNLIVMSSKKNILNDIQSDSYNSCFPSSYDAERLYNTDARPFYFLWSNNQLTLLGPKNIVPPINELFNQSTDYLVQ